MELYPAGPKAVPADLTKPTSRLKLHAWLAVLALLTFVVLYFWLTGWFGWTAFRFLRDGFTSGHAWIGFFKAIPAAFVFAFLLRGLFAVKHAQNKSSIEIHAEDEPDVFAFLYRIADEAGAPRPHRVFLAPDVNAGVFYDLSLLNLILPSKKNLVVGLGVMSSLDLGEIKAVMAHEFGHFAQKSMAVGRWVYISEQIAGNIVGSRGVFDRFLNAISYTDIRIAWIGWIMKVFVWSVRAVLDTAFLLVILAKQALSREMELQADLVAVSLTGSDALVHALHKLHAADDAFGRAVGFAQSEVAKGKVVEDLYAVQEHMLTSVRRITSDETYGSAPALPATAPETHRVFPDRFAQPPKMWSTHPPNREREDNAKRVYISCGLDARPAWTLFRDPGKRRLDMTRHFLALVNEKQGLPSETLTTAEAIERVDESFGRTYLDTRYRGLYLARGVTRNAATLADVYEPSAVSASFTSMPTFDDLYPATLVDELETWKDLNEEHATLKALKDGFLKAPGGVVRYRGEEVSSRDLSRVIDDVDRDCKAALEQVITRDRRCRTAHMLAARELGGAWEEYLTSLASLLHYAEHTEADIRDADGHFANVFAVVIADGRVSNAERRRLVAAANEAYAALARPFLEKNAIHLPDAVAKRMDLTSWSQRLGELTLNLPSEQNIGDWLRVADSWLLSVPNDFASLRAHTLEVLLDTEEHIRRCVGGECEAAEAPEPGRVPAHYPTLLPGGERKRQTRLDFWDRFQLAEGLFPAVARLAVALAVLSVGFLLGDAAISHTLIAYNGLETSVDVQVGDEQISLRPRTAMEVDLDDEDTVHIVARSRAGELIDELDADVSNSQSQYVYNVAGASPLVEWRAEYSSYGTGRAYEPEFTPRGTPRITTTEATVLFREPPSSMSTSSSSGTTSLLVIDGAPTSDPGQVLSMVTDPAERAHVIEMHALYDETSSTYFTQWLAEARALPQASDIIATRLRSSSDVNLYRYEQDVATGDARAAVCERHRALAQSQPSPDFEYLVSRCLTDRAEQARAFIAGHEAYPQNPFFARAAGTSLAAAGEYERAVEALETARRLRPELAAEVVGEIARVRRAMADEPDFVDLEVLAHGSSMLERLVGLEKGADWAMSGPARAYVMLAQGNLDQAVGLADAGSDPQLGPYVLRLAAASDYASDALRERALGLSPEEGIAGPTVWPAIALARHEGRDYQPLVAKAAELYGPEIAAQMIDWSDRDKLGTDLEAMDVALGNLDVTLRGYARVMALLTLGEAAPRTWRHEARALLFAAERPYLMRPTDNVVAE